MPKPAFRTGPRPPTRSSRGESLKSRLPTETSSIVLGATLIEVTAIVGFLFLNIRVLDLVGVVGAVLALFGGRLLGNTAMMFPVYRVLVANGIYRG